MFCTECPETLRFRSTDYSLNYIPTVFGKEWFEAELARPENERHPLFQWRVNGMQYLNAYNQVQPDGSYAALPSGPLAAYASFAFNLFAVEDNSRLDEGECSGGEIAHLRHKCGR